MTIKLFPSQGNAPYKVLSGLFRKEIAMFNRAMGDPRLAQWQRLEQILSLSKKSEFGKEHSLSAVKDFDSFRSRVPIHCYDDLEPWIEQISLGNQNVLQSNKVISFVETSGTTDRPKLIPVTNEWSKHISSAQRLWTLGILRDFPGVADGSILNIVSAANQRKSKGGLPIGANTGRMEDQLPGWIRKRYTIPDIVKEITDVECKIYTILRFALQTPVTSWTTANPSTILLYCRKLKEYRRELEKDLRAGTLRHGPTEHLSDVLRRQLETALHPTAVPFHWEPAKIWPLNIVNCWTGGPAKYFVSRLSNALGADIPIRDVGITASEGYFAIPLHDSWEGGVLWTLGEVMEFRDLKGGLHWPWEIKLGERYQLIITTSSGLFRYDLKDIVEVTGFYLETPIIRFVGKAGRYLNAVGEKVAEEQLSMAIQSIPMDITGFTGRIHWGEIPNIEVAVEAELLPVNLDVLLDNSLQKINIEYASKRESGRLGKLKVLALPEGTYDRFRLRRVKNGAPLSQVKDPIIAIDDKEWSMLKNPTYP